MSQSSGMYGNYHRSSSRRPRPTTSSFGSVNTLFGRLSLFVRRSHSYTEPQQRPRRALLSRGPRIVEVAAVKDREVIFTVPPPPEKTQQQIQSHAHESSTTQPASGANSTAPHSRYLHSLPVRLLGHLVLFLCCAPPRHADANAQQQGQSTGQAQPQASSLQTQSTAASISTTPALAASPTAASA
ncbi:uncharacterized protein F5891DRAFT_487383 [Suillus fuscotomentosus]|uniref:Uncharacterized protein n=1 Tax=Suillus fuscotomentosus TaxID=1912939 RepID=A0AAD4HHR7_9AGAM|nr:uncharacterized protein F5891DRAFT_487383 [Suillus fuscotomentosus]KAG1898110.1 hypothetical protein F5891DRAFT_487383 [Suillus fuscotomentosus]